MFRNKFKVKPLKYWLNAYNSLSLKELEITWSPMGIPESSFPLGMEIAGTPETDACTVNKSSKYIATGSSPCSPNLNAVVGVVGSKR